MRSAVGRPTQRRENCHSPERADSKFVHKFLSLIRYNPVLGDAFPRAIMVRSGGKRTGRFGATGRLTSHSFTPAYTAAKRPRNRRSAGRKSLLESCHSCSRSRVKYTGLPSDGSVARLSKRRFDAVAAGAAAGLSRIERPQGVMSTRTRESSVLCSLKRDLQRVCQIWAM